MKAIAITRAATAGSNVPFLSAIELPVPVAAGHDLLIEVKAISVNPVDTKVRAGFTGDTPRVLGWDAVGVVNRLARRSRCSRRAMKSGMPVRWGAREVIASFSSSTNGSSP